MPKLRYDMPALFGPSPMPDQTRVPRAEAIIIPFETTRDAAAKLLPRHFELPDTAIVSVSRIDYHDVDYLGGRGYREVVVSVAAVHEGPGGRMQAAFATVLWVSEVAALISGREYMGLAKLPAEMGPVQAEDGLRRFSCSEYGAPLVDGEVRELRPLAGEKLERVRRGSAEVKTFGWKYIPSAEDPPDADYPLVNVMQWDYVRAWDGQGRLTIHRPDARSAPMSSRVLAVLSELPVLDYRRAFVGEGQAVINRAATRRLHGRVRSTEQGEYGIALPGA